MLLIMASTIYIDVFYLKQIMVSAIFFMVGLSSLLVHLVLLLFKNTKRIKKSIGFFLFSIITLKITSGIGIIHDEFLYEQANKVIAQYKNEGEDFKKLSYYHYHGYFIEYSHHNGRVWVIIDQFDNAKRDYSNGKWEETYYLP